MKFIIFFEKNCRVPVDIEMWNYSDPIQSIFNLHIKNKYKKSNNNQIFIKKNNVLVICFNKNNLFK